VTRENSYKVDLPSAEDHQREETKKDQVVVHESAMSQRLQKQGLYQCCLIASYDILYAQEETGVEWIACPLCAATRAKKKHQEGDYVMVRCLQCGFIYQNPRPSEEERLQSYQHYLPQGTAEIEAWGRMMEPIFTKAADLIEHAMPKGRLLDVGTGYGFFPALMHGRGWKVMGLEASAAGARYGQERWGFPILAQPWEKASFPKKEFNVVTAFYVIEHLPDPLAFLREVHRILQPGGIILLRYPHTTPIKDILSLMRIENHLYHLPYHLCDFSPASLHRALATTGFARIKTVIGGFTAPPHPTGQWAGIIFGNLAEIVYQVSGGIIILPGVSKTTIARKVEQ
jgi:2-polyprenyl-3-methyl-5-hydroxy-6-metoxy-1,4-benzoquinol methylase